MFQNDHELEERFHHLEKLLKISVSNRRASFQSSSSLNDLDSQDSKDETKCMLIIFCHPEYFLFTTLLPNFYPANLQHPNKAIPNKFLDSHPHLPL